MTEETRFELGCQLKSKSPMNYLHPPTTRHICHGREGGLSRRLLFILFFFSASYSTSYFNPEGSDSVTHHIGHF